MSLTTILPQVALQQSCVVRVDGWHRYPELEESDAALALLKSMLEFDPSHRPTPVRSSAA